MLKRLEPIETIKSEAARKALRNHNNGVIGTLRLAGQRSSRPRSLWNHMNLWGDTRYLSPPGGDVRSCSMGVELCRYNQGVAWICVDVLMSRCWIRRCMTLLLKSHQWLLNHGCFASQQSASFCDLPELLKGFIDDGNFFLSWLENVACPRRECLDLSLIHSVAFAQAWESHCHESWLD